MWFVESIQGYSYKNENTTKCKKYLTQCIVLYTICI